MDIASLPGAPLRLLSHFAASHVLLRCLAMYLVQAPHLFQLRLELFLTIVLQLDEYLLRDFALVPRNLIFNVIEWLAQRTVYIIKGTILG